MNGGIDKGQYVSAALILILYPSGGGDGVMMMAGDEDAGDGTRDV